jgi:outer membrane protein assembly factor BamB
MLDNVFCLDTDGSLLWRIGSWNAPPDSRIYSQAFIENEQPVFWSRDGFVVTVDRDTGIILGHL